MKKELQSLYKKVGLDYENDPTSAQMFAENLILLNKSCEQGKRAGVEGFIKLFALNPQHKKMKEVYRALCEKDKHLKSLDKPQKHQGWHEDSDIAWGRGAGVTRKKLKK